MSIVTTFQLGDVKLLFAGDMQLADPQIADPQLQGEVDALRERIRAAAPFSLVKLSHHGSDDAFDAELLAELGATPLFGICAGEDSMSHPNPRVLRLLDAERDRLRWVRTDHNGLCTVTFDGQITVTPAHGELNDARPNTPDVQPARLRRAEQTAQSGRRCRTPGKRAKSRSYDTMSAPCSMARAAR